MSKVYVWNVLKPPKTVVGKQTTQYILSFKMVRMSDENITANREK